MKVKMILPALSEVSSPWVPTRSATGGAAPEPPVGPGPARRSGRARRPVKYSLFPPLGLATLAAHCSPDDEVAICDEHVEPLDLDDDPDLVVIQAYITSARRSYEIADHYRARGIRVAIGGLHPTSLPDEAAAHADHVFCGPGDDTWPRFLADLAADRAAPRYQSLERTLVGAPPIRRDLIRRNLYLVPNSIVVTRGCPHSCDFCYRDAFFRLGRGFYTQPVDDALAEIDRLPGRHLYFLDDHLLGHRRFARDLFAGMEGMGRVWQAAGTVRSILDDDLIERAARAGLRSLFVGLETMDEANLRAHDKNHNVGRDYARAVGRLHELGIMVNASFVFGMDGDGPDVFERTVSWAIDHGVETATFHVLTPYPGTDLYRRMDAEGRILHHDWDRYDTRQAVFTPTGMSVDELETGYWWAYREFYRWRSIVAAAATKLRVTPVADPPVSGDEPAREPPPAPSRWHGIVGAARHVAYAGGWKKFEWLWDAVIRARRVPWLLPALERVLDARPRRAPALARLRASGDGSSPRPTAPDHSELTAR